MTQPKRFDVTNEQIVQAAIEAFNTHHEERHYICVDCSKPYCNCEDRDIIIIPCQCEGWKKALEHLVERVREECYQQYKRGALNE